MTFEEWMLANRRAFPAVGEPESVMFDLIADFIEFRTGERPALNRWGDQLNNALRGVKQEG